MNNFKNNLFETLSESQKNYKNQHSFQFNLNFSTFENLEITQQLNDEGKYRMLDYCIIILNKNLMNI